MQEQAELLLRGRLDGSQRNKVKSLLNMMYTPKELGEEIGIDRDRFYLVYLPMGCPYVRDINNRISINGIEFKKWFEGTYKKVHLEKNQAYCISCKRIVTIDQGERKQKKNLVYYIYICPNCGHETAKIIDAKRKKHDQQKELAAY